MPAVEAGRLRVTEIFLSIQGESTRAGLPTVFVRTTGCPLRCGYCDTAYAFSGGETMTLEAVLGRVAELGARCVTVTGGEPLAQPATVELLRRLCDAGHAVSLETSGAVPLESVDERVMTVMDLKTPGSGEVERNLWENLARLRAGDQVKFVCCDRADYEWCRDRMARLEPAPHVEFLFSPVHGRLEARELAEWLLADGLDARLQLQLHKYLWGDEPGR